MTTQPHSLPESPMSKLERAFIIATHLDTALGEVTHPKLAGVKKAFRETAHQITTLYWEEFRKANPEFVKHEQQAAKDRAEFEAGEKRREKMLREMEEEEKRIKREEEQERLRKASET